jgi:pre-rRNA-processing protein TSR1
VALLLQVCINPDENTGLCTLLVSGYLRAHNLSVNQLVCDLCLFFYLFLEKLFLSYFVISFSNTFSIPKVHVSGAGDFHLGQIDVLKDPCPLSERKISDVMETEDNGIQVCCIEDLKAFEIE